MATDNPLGSALVKLFDNYRADASLEEGLRSLLTALPQEIKSILPAQRSDVDGKGLKLLAKWNTEAIDRLKGFTALSDDVVLNAKAAELIGVLEQRAPHLEGIIAAFGDLTKQRVPVKFDLLRRIHGGGVEHVMEAARKAGSFQPHKIKEIEKALRGANLENLPQEIERLNEELDALFKEALSSEGQAKVPTTKVAAPKHEGIIGGMLKHKYKIGAGVAALAVGAWALGEVNKSASTNETQNGR